MRTYLTPVDLLLDSKALRLAISQGLNLLSQNNYAGGTDAEISFQRKHPPNENHPCFVQVFGGETIERYEFESLDNSFRTTHSSNRIGACVHPYRMRV